MARASGGQYNRGFTFIELMVALAILGVLALVSAPVAQLVSQRQKERELRLALIEVRAAIDAYKRAAEQGRIQLKIGESGYPPDLRVLADGVLDQRSPTKQKIYFLRRVPSDPFSKDGLQDPSRSWGLRSYASPPDLPQEGADVFDVYSRSPGVGLNGVPYARW